MTNFGVNECFSVCVLVQLVTSDLLFSIFPSFLGGAKGPKTFGFF